MRRRLRWRGRKAWIWRFEFQETRKPRLCNVTCTRCGFAQTVTQQGRYAYLLDDGTQLDVTHKIAWCDECARIVHAEALPNLEEIDKVIAATKHAKRRRLEQERHEWRLGRKSPARCLTGGSTDVATIEKNPDPEPTPHADCSGELHFDHAGYYRPYALDELFNSEGVSLQSASGAEEIDESEQIPGRMAENSSLGLDVIGLTCMHRNGIMHA